MNSATIAVHWHDENQPVYALDFQKQNPAAPTARRLATGGGDNNVRIWNVLRPASNNPQETTVDYRSTLRKHTQAVNAVRFDPQGQILATGGDDGLLILWTLSSSIVTDFGFQDDDVKESWVPQQVINTNSEIYDLAWLPDSAYIACGSMDNKAKIYSVKGTKITELSDHSHYVQGVAWDSSGQYFATQSADRSVHLYTVTKDDPQSEGLGVSLLAKHNRTELPSVKVSLLAKSANSEASETVERPKRLMALYHPETLQSFFRRLAFSPDGALLVSPSGTYRGGSKDEDAAEEKGELANAVLLNTVYIYTRATLKSGPVCHLPGLAKPAIAVAFSPRKYKLLLAGPNLFKLPYKMVFAVATQDAVVIYSTDDLQPLGMLSNLHYLTITDLCWELDGYGIVVSSADGFCSVISFDHGVFGEDLDPETLIHPEPVATKLVSVKAEPVSAEVPVAVKESTSQAEPPAVTSVPQESPAPETNPKPQDTTSQQNEPAATQLEPPAGPQAANPMQAYINQFTADAIVGDGRKRITPTLVKED